MSARIFGTVRNAANNALISTAIVTAPPYTVTCSNGSYSLTTPGAATVTVTASATGFVSQSTTVTVANGENRLLNFLLNAV